MSGRGPVTRVDGLARLARTLKGAGEELGDLKALNRAVGALVTPAARASAPIGPAAGGHLAATVRYGATPRGVTIRVGGAARPYAGGIHWGWPRRRIAPNPWVYAAAERLEPSWTGIYRDGVARILSKVAGK